MRNDRYFSAKLGLKLNRNFDSGAIVRCLSAHASTKLQSNRLDQLMMRNNVFVRYMTMWHNYQITSSLSAGSVHNLVKNADAS